MGLESEKPIDASGRAILRALQEDARMTYSELGRRVNLSAPAVAERVRRLEEQGWISGYHVEIPPEKMGYSMQAFIRLQAPAEKYPRVLACAQGIPEIVACHHITGEDAFILHVYASSTHRLDEIIAMLGSFGSTSTSVVLSTPLKRSLPLAPN